MTRAAPTRTACVGALSILARSAADRFATNRCYQAAEMAHARCRRRAPRRGDRRAGRGRMLPCAGVADARAGSARVCGGPAERLRAGPAATHLARTGAELLSTRGRLLGEDARVRRPLVVVQRRVKRPAMAAADRTLLVLLAGRSRTGRQALLVVRPDTPRRGPRAGCRALRCRKSRPGPGRPPLPAGTVARIRRMASENPRRGAERMRDERQQRGSRARAGSPGRRPRAPTPRTAGPATPARHRSALPTALRLLRHPARHAARGAGGHDAPPDRRPGRPAAARGHAVRPAPALPRP